MKKNMQYIAILINKGMDNILYSNAALKSRYKIDINPLVIPHPKQEIPKKVFTGHKETEKIFVKTNRKAKKTNPTLNECKVCLFLLSMFLILYQWLSIAISKTA